MFRQRLGNNDTSRRCLNQAFLKLAVVVHIFETAFNLGVQVHNFLIQSQLNFVKVREDHSFAGHAFSIIGQVVDTQNHILGRNDNRFTRSRRQNVVGRHHQDASLQLSLDRQRNVNSHLVTVEVGVERGTNQRMQVNGLTFDQYRFKCLNTQTVQRRRTVQKNRMLTDNFFKNIPYFRTFFSTMRLAAFMVVA